MRTGTLGLVGTVVAALLAGCGGGDKKTAPTATPAPTATLSPGPTGTPSPTPPGGVFTIATDADPETAIALGSDGSRWLVAYGVVARDSSSDVVATRLAADGTRRDDPAILVSDTSLIPDTAFNPVTGFYSSPAIAFGAGGYAITFFGSGGQGEDGEEPPYGQAILLVGLTVEGMLAPSIFASAENLSIGTPQPALFPPPAVAVLGDDPLVLWSSGAGNPSFCPGAGSPCRLFLASNFGVSVAPSPPDLILPTSAASIAAASVWALAAWGEAGSPVDPASPSTRVQGAAVFLGQEPQPVRLATTARPVVATAVAASESSALVAWSEPATGGGSTENEVRARLFEPGSGPLGPEEGLVLGKGTDPMLLGGAAFTSGTYLVVWISSGQAMAARVSAAGNPEPPFSLGTSGATRSAVAANATGFLVAFLREEGASAEVAGTLLPPLPGLAP